MCEDAIGFLCVGLEGERRPCGPAARGLGSLGSVLTGLLGEREPGTMSLCVARAFARGPGGRAA